MGVEKLPWSAKLALLQRYKERHGTANVPTRYSDPSTGFRLGGWVHHLRQTRHKIPLEQVEILNQVGFVWNASKEWPWPVKLEALQRFHDQHLHYKVPRLYVDPASGFKLGQWVPSLRRKNASVPPARRRDLERVGFFEASSDTSDPPTSSAPLNSVWVTPRKTPKATFTTNSSNSPTSPSLLSPESGNGLHSPSSTALSWTDTLWVPEPSTPLLMDATGPAAASSTECTLPLVPFPSPTRENSSEPAETSAAAGAVQVYEL